MNPPDPRIETVFHEALARASTERDAFVSAASEGDAAVMQGVHKLLSAHEEAGTYFERCLPPDVEATLTRLKPEESGDIIGPFTLREKIGEGGFGSVWAADQRLPIRRQVALKILKVGMDTQEVVARFEQERQALAMMDHPNIAKVFDAGATQSGRPFFVMELVRGVKVTKYCDTEKLSTQQRVELFTHVCHAVQHAHQKGIIHRDLKPSNILVASSDGTAVPKVIDFGVAKALQGKLADQTIYTQHAQIIGTTLYMSPEQAQLNDSDIDTRTDIYSLGVLLYKLLTGSTPIEQETLDRVGVDEVRRIIREVDPPRPSARAKSLLDGSIAITAKRHHSDSGKFASSLRGDLDWIVMKCLEKDRSRRYATANDLALDLRRFIACEPVLARPPSHAYRVRRFARRNKVAVLAAATVGVALVVGMIGIVSQWQRAETAGQVIRERLAHEHIRAGLQMAEAGDGLRGLPHYVEAFRLGLPTAAREQVTRLRFEMTLRQSPQLTQYWPRRVRGQAFLAEDARRVVAVDGPDAFVWNSETGAPAMAPLHHAGSLQYVWVDKAVSRLVTLQRPVTHPQPIPNIITVWEPDSARILCETPGTAHLRAVLGGPRLRLALWLPNERWVRCLSARDGAIDAAFDHPEPVEWAAASPDGTRIVSASGDFLYLWDVASNALVVPPVDFGGKAEYWCFDPTGRHVALRVKNQDGLALFDLATGAFAARGATNSRGSVGHGWFDGNRWVVLARKFSGSSLRDPVTDRLLFDAPSGAGTAASSFATRRNIFALAGENGAVQLWDGDAAQAIPPRLWAADRPHALQLGADATQLLVNTAEPAVRLWKMPAHGGAAWAVVEPAPTVGLWWNARGEICTISADGRMNRRDVATGEAVSPPASLGEAVIGAVPDRPGRLFMAHNGASARLWNAENGGAAGPDIPSPAPITAVALCAEGSTAAILAGNTVLVCDPVSGTVRHTLTHTGALRCLLSPNGARAATVTSLEMQLWDARTGQPIGKPIVDNSDWHHANACFDSTGVRCAVWWMEPELPGHVRLIDSTTGLDLQPPLAHPSAIREVAFSAAGELLVVGTGDQRLWLWNLRENRPVIAPILHSHAINAVGFSLDGMLFWSRTARQFFTWEASTGDAATPSMHHRGPPPGEPARYSTGAVVTHDHEEVRLAWGPDHQVITCDSRGGLNRWDLRISQRSLEQMDVLARVLSSHRIDASGGLIPLTRDELRDAWQQWRTIAPSAK